MSISISLTWSAGVTDWESEVFSRAVHQTLHWLFFRHPDAFFDPPIRVETFGNWEIPAIAGREPHWGTQWYVDSAYDRDLGRVIAPVYLELVRRAPWQETTPHLDLALLEEDLTEFPAPLARQRRDHYCLGTSYPGQAAVMSVYRLRMLAEFTGRERALTRLVRHHLGHVLAIPPFERTERVRRRGLETHCTNRCAMRHPQTVAQLLAYIDDEKGMGWPFCPECTSALHSVIVAQAGNWN